MISFRQPSKEARASGSVDFEGLYASCADEVLVFLARRTADPQIALDIWAETFAQAHEGWSKFRGRTMRDGEAWIHGIARRQLASFYRRGQIEQSAMRRLHLERPAASPGVLRELERDAALQDVRDELARALASLSPAVREAVQLRVVDELEYRDVALRLQITEQAARVRVSRGLASLGALVDKSVRVGVSE